MRTRGRTGTSDNAALHHLRLKARGKLAVARKVLLRGPIFDEFHSREQPFTASDISCIRMVAESRDQIGVEPRTHFLGILAKSFAFYDLDILQCNRAAGGMPRVCVAVHPAV